MRAWSVAIGTPSLPLSCSATCDRSGEGRTFSSCLFSQIWLGRWTTGDNGQQKQALGFSQAFLRKGSWLEHQLRSSQQSGQKSSRISDRSRLRRFFSFQRLLNTEPWHLSGARVRVCVPALGRVGAESLASEPFCTAVAASAERDKVPSPDASSLAMLLSANFPRAGNTRLSMRPRHCFSIHIPKDSYQHFHGRLKTICLRLSVQLIMKEMSCKFFPAFPF